MADPSLNPIYGTTGVSRISGGNEVPLYGTGIGKTAAAKELFERVVSTATPEAVQASVERATQPQIEALVKAGRDESVR